MMSTALALATAWTASAHAAKDIVIGVHEDFTTMDPHMSNDTLSMSAQRLMMPGLFGFDENMKVIPVLADGYDASDDAKVFTIRLRKGVKFHDGTDFNAAAVKATFDRVSNPDNKLRRYTLFSNIAKTDVIDDTTVRMQLKQPFASMINVLAHPSAAIISPANLEKFGKDISQNPVGAGPYKFVTWKQGDHLRVEKNPNYYKPGLPKVDSITLRPTPENATRVAMLQSGTAHFVYPMAPEQMKSLEGNPNVEAVAKPSVWARYMNMNVTKKPFDDVRVRHALNHAVNKRAFAKVVFSGFAEPMNSIMADPVEFHRKQGEYAYDPNKAKQLLAEAGHPNGFETEIWGANTSTTIRGMEFIQQQLALVGVKAKIVPMERGTRVEKMEAVSIQTAEMRMNHGGWSPSTGEADWAIRPLFGTESHPPKSFNLGFYSNPKVDELIQQGLAIPDPGKRAAIYGEIQKVIWNDAPWIFLVSENNLWAKSKKLEGVFLLPDGSLMAEQADLK
jgi:glutathione transport system substrate-binding protein